MRLAFHGRATRNFLFLLCMMEFVLVIDRVNLAAAAPVMQKDLGLSNIALGFPFSVSITRTLRLSGSEVGLPIGLAPGVL